MSFTPIDQATGPDAEARQAGYANWYWAARGIMDGIDNETRNPIPMTNNGLDVGIALDGSLFVQGSTDIIGNGTKTASAAISPVLILGAVLAYMLLRKG